MNEIFVKLANMSVAAGWLILAVLVLRLALKKAPRWITCLLWAAVAVRLVCPVSFQSPVSAYQVAAPAAVQPSGQVEYFQYVHASGDKPSIQLDVDAIRPAETIDGPTVAAAPADESPAGGAVTRYLPPYVAIWLAVGAALLLYGLASTLRLRFRVREAVRLRDNVWECDAVTSPFLLGLFRPRIYLPSGMDEGQMAYVLSHEQAHLRRLDHVWKPLAYVLLAIHWFNPLVWVAYILFCRDIETACDQRAIRDLDLTEKKAYSAALLQCSQGRRMVLACPVAFGEEGVKGRIKAVLNYKKPAFWVVLVALAACVAVAVCFLTDPVSGGKKGTLTFVEKENIVSTWRADFAVDNSDASLSAVLYADVWKDGQRESTRLLTMTKNVTDLSVQLTRPERNEQMLPMFSLWVITDAYGGYGGMSDGLKEMPKDIAFAAYQDGEQRQVAAGDTIVLAALAADFGGGLPQFDCRALEKQPDIAQNADYMIVVRASFALDETAPVEDDGSGEVLGQDTDNVHVYMLPTFRLPVEVDITGVEERDSGVDLATLVYDHRWVMHPTDDQPTGADRAITLRAASGDALYIESGADRLLWVSAVGTSAAYSSGMTGDEIIDALSSWAWQMKKNIARSKEAVPDAATFFARFPGGGFRWDVYGQSGSDSAALVGQLYDYAANNTLTADQCRALLCSTDGLDGAYSEGYAAALVAAYQNNETAYLQAWQGLTDDQQRAVPTDPDGILPRPAGTAVSTTGGAAFPLSEKAVTTALNDVGLPLTISPEETQSYTEGQIAYTLRGSGEDLFPWGAVSSAVYDGGKRHLTVMYQLRPEGDTAFRWEDWRQAITLAGKLWGGFEDDGQLYRQLSELNIPDDSVTGASWEAETDGGFCSVGYTVSMIQGKPNHVTFSINFYDSQQEYRQRLKETMQKYESLRLEQNQLLEQTD